MLIVDGLGLRLDLIIATRRPTWWEVFRSLGACPQKAVLTESGLLKQSSAQILSAPCLTTWSALVDSLQ